jgi:hypothetical protein
MSQIQIKKPSIELQKNSVHNVGKMLSSTKYYCEHCKNTFGLKYNYDRHVSVCQFFKKNNREQTEIMDHVSDTIPSYRELFHLVKDLNRRLEIVEKENSTLRRHQQIQTRKINILNRLNAMEKPQMTFLKWVKEKVLATIVQSLETVFQEDLFVGIQSLLDQALSTTPFTEIPIKSFEPKMNFYVFVENTDSSMNETKKEWILLTTNQLDGLWRKICQQFLVDFDLFWVQPNRDKIDKQEEWKDRYVLYYKKILGNDKISEESFFQKCNHGLFHKIKRKKETLLSVV